MTQLYDDIGTGYANLRRPDPRIGDAIDLALDDAKTVLNVGAGTGSYEPRDRNVIALEPSFNMIRQRLRNSARNGLEACRHLHGARPRLHAVGREGESFGGFRTSNRARPERLACTQQLWALSTPPRPIRGGAPTLESLDGTTAEFSPPVQQPWKPPWRPRTVRRISSRFH